MLIKVRVYRHRYFRGRCTGIESKVVPALVVMVQRDHSIVVELLEEAYLFRKGYNLAVFQNDIVK
jgi:hypothetical protein